MAQRLEHDLNPSGGQERRPSYDWETWLDGKQWVLVRGEDFEVNPWVFRAHAKNMARQRGVQLHTRVGDDRVWIQSDRPAPPRRDSSGSQRPPGVLGVNTQRVLAVVAEAHPARVRRVRLTQKLPDIPRGTLDSILSRCVRRGHLQRPEPHMYTLADPPTTTEEPTTP